MLPFAPHVTKMSRIFGNLSRILHFSRREIFLREDRLADINIDPAEDARLFLSVADCNGKKHRARLFGDEPDAGERKRRYRIDALLPRALGIKGYVPAGSEGVYRHSHRVDVGFASVDREHAAV